MAFKSGSINKCSQSTPVTLYLYIWLKLSELFYFVGEFKYFAWIVLKLDKLYFTCIVSYNMDKIRGILTSKKGSSSCWTSLIWLIWFYSYANNYKIKKFN